MADEPVKEVDGDYDVTVVITCYNHEKYVRTALEAAFGQTYRRCRIHVVDDASKDRSVRTIEESLACATLPTTFDPHPDNRGLCRSLNDALAGISTKYVSFMSADDWMEPTRVEELVAYIEALGDEYGVVYSDAYLADEAGDRLPGSYLDHSETPVGDVFEDLIEFNSIPAPTVLVRRSLYDRLGGYDESLAFEDYDMWLRMATVTKFGYLDRKLVTYRGVPGSMLDNLYKNRDVYADSLIRCQMKHFGRSASADRRIADFVGGTSKELYLEGRSSAVTAGELRRVFAVDRSYRTLLYVLLASAGVPGRFLSRTVDRVRRLRSKVRSWT